MSERVDWFRIAVIAVKNLDTEGRNDLLTLMGRTAPRTPRAPSPGDGNVVVAFPQGDAS